MILQTPRVTVRRLTAEDYDSLYAVYSTPKAMRWVDDGQPITPTDCRRWLDVTLNNYATRGYGMFALQRRSDDQVFGFCGLVHPGGQEEAEIKYALLEETWGQGFASEVVAALLQHAHEAFELSVVIATIDADNAASRRVLTKVGMRLRDSHTHDDGSVGETWEWNPTAPDPRP